MKILLLTFARNFIASLFVITGIFGMFSCVVIFASKFGIVPVLGLSFTLLSVIWAIIDTHKEYRDRILSRARKVENSRKYPDEAFD